MYGVVEYFANGFVFFVGAFLISVSAYLGSYRTKVRRSRVLLLCLIGVVLIIVSAAPFSYFYYGLCFVLLLLWCRSISGREIHFARKLSIFLILQLLIWTGILYEATYQFYPHSIDSSFPRLIVFGDSVTSGMGGDKIETWPRILRREQDLQIQDLSQVGATVSTALKKAKQNELVGNVAIVEIGGNDLFGSTSMKDFEADLDELLQLLKEQDKIIYLFELPLIPFYNEYGRIQRRLAKKYYVRLIPKRVLMGVLAGDDATIDSIHLTQAGHREMAKRVFEIVYGKELRK